MSGTTISRGVAAALVSCLLVISPITLVVIPASPSAGDLIKVSVLDSPSWPVSVTIEIDGKVVASGVLADDQDLLTYQTSPEQAGLSWKVSAAAGSESEEDSGIL